MTYLRQMPQVTKDKISSSLTGRKMSDETKRKISVGVKKAWSKVPKTTEVWTSENNKNNTNEHEESENEI